MKSFLRSVILLVTTVLMSNVSARNWREGDGGLVRWDFDCNFNRHDIQFMPSLPEQCGGVCIANRRCTHFTHSGGTCALKRNTGSSFREDSLSGHTCGFVLNRSGQPLP
ncbi:Uncharacterized protein APZ42_013935 [Daphnia magna]|uniref:Brain chitinase and chia n=2 Tax=Daphnia magna TaxID=35525 RepID=A0A0P6A8C9_9CRUS|nr:hypothetical protein OUZ56_024946 [Daphnia magna]KZS19587.1 Uncharacterized protein APZ42_013935 [Daphnia magna]